MAAVSAFLPTLSSICRTNSNHSSSTSTFSSFTIPIRAVRFQTHGYNSYSNLSILKTNSPKLTKIRSLAEEQTIAPEQEEQISTTTEEATTEQPVSVPVSPSDVLTMFFQAEGTIDEESIPKVAKAIEETGGISNLQVQVLEGIASVQLKKQTTVQATGVASSLVEIIQGSGFKLQTLNLSFEDEEDVN